MEVGIGGVRESMGGGRVPPYVLWRGAVVSGGLVLPRVRHGVSLGHLEPHNIPLTSSRFYEELELL